MDHIDLYRAAKLMIDRHGVDAAVELPLEMRIGSAASRKKKGPIDRPAKSGTATANDILTHRLRRHEVYRHPNPVMLTKNASKYGVSLMTINIVAGPCIEFTL